jgi:putative ABC transport system permease protein
VPLLGPAETTLVSPLLGGTGEYAGDASYPVFVVSRQNAADHLQVVAGPRGAGVWLPDAYAAFVHLSVGDQITVHAGPATTTLPVAAIYHSLRDQPDQPWWCDLLNVYKLPAGNQPPPEVLFVDQQTFVGLPPGILVRATQRTAFLLNDSNLNQDQARQMSAGIAEMRQTLTGPGVAVDGSVGAWYGSSLSSLVPQFTGRADLVRHSMLSTVLPISGAGVLVGLIVVGSAATFWVRRRRQELTMLSARGVGSIALAVKAIAETWPALVIGTAAGFAGSWLLVRRTGPDPVLSGEAAPGALLSALACLALQLAAVGIVAGVACRSLTDQTRARRLRVVRWLPYELLLLAGAPVLWTAMGDSRIAGDPSNGLGTAIQVPGRLLVVPIMVVSGVTILAARLGGVYLRASRRRPQRTNPAFLARRRISRQAVMVAVLAAATALPVAIASYAATVTRSVETTIDDEARLFLGTDVVLTLSRPADIPPSLQGQATQVLRAEGTIIGGIETDVLAVDPDSFARVAYWTDSLASGASLRQVLSAITTPPAPGSPSTIVASARTPAGTQRVTWWGLAALGGTVHVVSVPTLPAQRAGYPVALVPPDGLGALAQYAVSQIWVRGDPAQILARVREANLPVRQIQVASNLNANSLLEPLTYTFEYLVALSLLTGAVILVGLLLYLEAQIPQRRRAYVLLRRMGLSAAGHRRALLRELALPLLWGFASGMAVAAGLVAALDSYFDPDPDTPPDTVLSVPYVALAVIASVTLLIGLAAATYAQARISRARAAEVLRDAI